MRAQGEGVVEYSGKVACPSGRRCSTRNAVWCHSHPGFKSQRYRHCRPAPLGPGGFVMPSWRAVWLCGCVAPRAAGRRRPRPPARLGDLTSFGAAPRSPARPCHRPPAPRQIPPAPSTPVGPGRWSVAGCVVSMPGRDLQPPITFARNSPATCSNIEFASLELQCFWGVSKMSTINYVRNLGGGGVVAARGHRGLALSARPPAYLKPLSPLRAQAEPQLKPLSPLRLRNGCFWRGFRLQWCCRFQWSLFGGEVASRIVV